ncbi:MAG: hypothetical protein A3F84_04825 [Candidatus Handelsmanbacteria bacterium RIFCSPLOWO2_12_FULL_64_10]|uniref:Uncharacterized protein n=1 Tax=Handelsmanbacteria sp. (strain RIFCSPLOWO2_12_FULL_64_10) TaxID=1817868 RepID=A0A1F6CXU5_HANXR|nr:MAG: hypothetical protein A3F84_04825 [Candidatus Handelsmanbacteria bacterium RIFCSPLOWO2_12_FULL_64_10]
MAETISARRMLIDMALRRSRPGAGSVLGFLRRRTADMNWPDLTAILHPLTWAVAGAVATRLYMPERTTRDLYIVVMASDMPEVRRRLNAAGFVEQGILTIGGASWRTPDGESIDVIEGRDPWWANALAEAQTNRDTQGLPILPLHYLALMKVRAGRVQDLADVARMLGQADEPALERTRAVFAQWAPDDVEDLESLIRLGRLEMEGGR